MVDSILTSLRLPTNAISEQPIGSAVHCETGQPIDLRNPPSANRAAIDDSRNKTRTALRISAYLSRFNVLITCGRAGAALAGGQGQCQTAAQSSSEYLKHIPNGPPGP